MRVLVVGAGGVGAAVAAVVRRSRFFDRMVFADLDERRARRAAAADERTAAVSLDATTRSRSPSSRGRDGGRDPARPPFLDVFAEYGAPHGVEDR